MTLMIAYRDKPDDVLYTFSKAGDNICIGRDKRQCGITLGVNAQGVSRVHLKLELRSDRSLVAKDFSTYGTGYDGGPLTVEKERVLKSGTVLQIGSSFFVILKKEEVEEEEEEKSLEHTLPKSTSSSAREASIRKRFASKDTVAVVEEYDPKRKKAKVTAEDEAVQEVPHRGKKAEQDKKDAELSGKQKRIKLGGSGMSAEEKERKLASVLGKGMESMDSATLAYYRRIVDFLPSDDESQDSSTYESTSKILGSNTAVSARKRSQTVEHSPQNKSSDGSACELVYDTYYSNTNISSPRREGDLPKPIAILDSAVNDNVEDDVDQRTPLLGSSQFASFRKKDVGSVNETSDLKKGSRFCDDVHFDDLFVSRKSEQSTVKRRRGRPSKASKNDKQTTRTTTEPTGLTSWLEKSSEKRRGSQDDDLINTEMTVNAKRAKMDMMEEEREAGSSREQEPEEDSDKTKAEMEQEVSDENVDDKELTLGMDIETLRLKLRKAVQFENLERPLLMDNNGSQMDDSLSSKDYSEGPNYKRFKKAPQGSYGEWSRFSMTSIVGTADLIDFRDLSS